MEETETTIHTGLMQRNNFLRENPMRWQFVAQTKKGTSAKVRVSGMRYGAWGMR